MVFATINCRAVSVRVGLYEQKMSLNRRQIIKWVLSVLILRRQSLYIHISKQHIVESIYASFLHRAFYDTFVQQFRQSLEKTGVITNMILRFVQVERDKHCSKTLLYIEDQLYCILGVHIIPSFYLQVEYLALITFETLKNAQDERVQKNTHLKILGRFRASFQKTNVN